MQNSINKKGVSLVAVLLFMLVATIAATATYKWLNSSGFSSAARMAKQAAYQSAVAGIENARTWMSYHANDVGGIIKQYKDGGNKPIRLNPMLQELSRSDQDFDIWLTGVNTEGSTYKLKLLSSGKGQNGSRYNLTSIFNVDGLYQVKIPGSNSSKVNFKEAFFGSAPNGISLDVTSAIINGNTTFNTAFEASEYVVVTGDVSVNSKTNVGDLYVQGNLYSCTNFNVSGNAYIEEEMYVNGTHHYSGDLYVGKGVDFSGTGTGKAQCSTGPGGGITVDGNLTSNGNIKMPRHTAGTKYVVNGDLVLNNGAYLDFPTYSEFDAVGSIPWQVHFNGNVYLDGGMNSDGWHVGYATAPNFSLGSTGKKVYSGTPIYRISTSSGSVSTSYTHWTQNYIYSYGNNRFRYLNKYGQWGYYGSLAANTYCNSEKCAPTYDFSSSYFWNNAEFYWPNWTTGYYNYGGYNYGGYNRQTVMTYPVGCTIAYSWGGMTRWNCATDQYLKRDEIFMQVNGDYTSTKPDTAGWGAERMLDYKNRITTESTTAGCGSSAHITDPIQFNKNLLTNELVHTKDRKMGCSTMNIWDSWPNNAWKQMSDCYEIEKQNSKLYEDNWLIVRVKDPAWATMGSNYLQGNFIIIIDSDQPAAGLYLPRTLAQSNGDASNVIVYFPNGFKATINSAGGDGAMNYFIYSDGDIQNVQFGSSVLTGAVFMSDCHTMGSDQTIQISYNESLTQALSDVGVICDNDGSGTCSTASSGSTSSSSGSSGSVYGSTDSYYVANAPQLSISLESQNKSSEDLPTAGNYTEVKEDFVVLPRVIYLTKNPYGKLSDYYNVVGLNGMSIDKANGSVSCDAESGISTSGNLYDRNGSDNMLTDGYYTCEFTYEGKMVPFYVVIKGTSGNSPEVAFTETNIEMGSSSNYAVQVSVPSHTDPITLNVIKPNDIDGWTFTPVSGTCSGRTCTFTIPANANSNDVTLFNVTTTNVSNGTAIFQLAAGVGYLVGTPSTEVLTVSTNVTVNRADLTTAELNSYCESNSGCPADVSAWPNCQTDDSWVKAVNGCNTTTTNESWDCGLTNDISLQATSSPDGCIVIIPSKTLSKDNLTTGETYTLPASLKALQKKFYFGFSGQDISGKTLIATITESSGGGRVGTEKTCTFGNDVATTSEHCSMDVFKGEMVSVSIEGDRPSNFNYWSCSGTNCPKEQSSSDEFSSFVITADDNYVIAHFDEKDKHCFFDEFKTGVNCDNSPYCISSNSEKWRTSTESASNLVYQNGYVAIKSSKTDKTGVIVMSTAEAGIEGTLKAQFQVPQLVRNTASSIPATIKNSGFILHSNLTNSKYLFLNVYADESGDLNARLCNEDQSTCQTQYVFSGSSKLNVSSTDVITMSAEVKTESITVTIYTGSLGSVSTYSTTFSLVDDFATYMNEGKYVGFRMAHPNFRLYDIGWKSDDYGSECWDTYPTVNCSFKSAYAGGVVPKGEAVTPWVGLSSWFDANGCTAHYYYNGNDANCGTGTNYSECYDSYTFTSTGAHGYNDDSGNEIKTAKAGAGSCSNLSDTDMLLAESERAHCGAFWVGELSYCTQNVYFAGSNSSNDAASIQAGDVQNFNLATNQYVNLREATLKIELNNPDNVEIEIYLLSQRDNSSQPFYSKSFTTNSGSGLSIDIESLLDEEGFDPQQVYGVAVRNLGSSAVYISAIYTICPNVVSLTCNQDMNYDDLTGKWKISATVTNFNSTKSFNISENSSYVTSHDYICSNNECGYTENGKSAVYTFEIADSEPLTEHEYKFTVNMTTTDNESFECTTNAATIAGIHALCGNLSTKSVKVGEGLPKFSYSMSNCPATGCPYKISLDNGTVITSGAASVSNGTTSSTAANTAESPLAEGTYKFKIESTSGTPLFESCESGEFKVRNTTSTLDVNCGVSLYTYGFSGGNSFLESDDLYFMAQNNESTGDEIKSIKVEKNGSQVGTVTISSWQGMTQAAHIGKLSKGEYTYSLVSGNEEICSYTITVKSNADNATLTCGVSTHTYDISGEDKFYTTQDLYFMAKNNTNTGNTIPGLTVLKNNTSVGTTSINAYSNWTNAYSIGNLDAGTYTFSIKNGDDEKCSDLITVENPLACSVDSTTISLGNSFILSTSYAGDCWGASLSGNGVPSASCDNTHTITPTATGTQTYTYKVTSGSLGTPECTQTVTVNEAAPIDMDGYSGTICLNGSWPEVSVEKGTLSGEGLSKGKYLVKHSCDVASGISYFYKCTKGANITWGTMKLTCDDGYSEIHGNAAFSSDNKDLIITSGTLTKFGCGASTASCTSGYTKNEDTSSSSAELSSSSEAISSSSEEISSSSSATSVNYTYNGEHTFEAGSYTISTCYGNTGSKTIQFYNNGPKNCIDAISSASNVDYWCNDNSCCNGSATVTVPFTINVPAGSSFKMSNCY